MPAHVVIIDFFLMLVSLLLKTDGAIGAVVVKPTEHFFDQPLQTIDDQETDQQTLQLLVGVVSSWRFIIGVNFALIFSHKYPRPQRQSHESLQRDILVIYYFQFHDVNRLRLLLSRSDYYPYIQLQ